MNKASQVAFARKLIRNKGVADDLIDVEAEIDEKLSFEENWSALRSKVEALVPQEKKVKEQVKEAKIKELEATAVANREYLAFVDKERETAIKHILESSDSEVIKEAFKPVRQLTRAVASGYSPAMIVKGAGAVGKTHNVQAELSEMGLKEKEDYVLLNTYSTPLEFYRMLWEYKDRKAVVLDDVAGLFNNDKTIALLKSALWGCPLRIVQYNSSTERLGAVPSEFIMNAGIIILTNQLPRNHPHIDAIISRCHYLELKFTREQIIRILYDFAKNRDYLDLTQEDRLKVIDWLVKNTNDAYDVNFRTLIKLYDLYRFDKEKWMELAVHLLQPDETKLAYLEAIEKSNTTKDAVEQFVAMTGHSRSKFFRVQREIRGKR